MTESKRSTVVGVFADPQQAQKAVEELRRAGFREDQIGVVAHDQEAKPGAATKGSHAGAGAAIGAASGAGAGALWALGIAAGVLPAIGPVVAGGLLASILASAAGGAVVAGIAGALIGLGVPEEEAHYYEGEFKSGRTLVTVKADGRAAEAWAILQRHGAYNRECAAQATTGVEATARHAEAGQTMQLHEEHLRPHKEAVNAGAAKVRKDVVTEQQEVQVPVTREEVVVERRPASGHASGADIRPGEEVRIPVSEERVHVDKENVVKEEVSVGKRKVTDTKPVSGTVRKEEVRVEREGDVDVRGTNEPRR